MAKESELAKRIKAFVTDADKVISSAKKLLEEIKPEVPPDDREGQLNEPKRK